MQSSQIGENIMKVLKSRKPSNIKQQKGCLKAQFVIRYCVNAQLWIKNFIWDPSKQEVDPREIMIHPETWGEICSQIRDQWEVGAVLILMSLGPSSDDGDPYKLS